LHWPTVEEARDLHPVRPYEPDDFGPDEISSSRSFSRPSNFKKDQFARPSSLGRRLSRTLGRFLLAVLIGAAGTLVWQHYSNDAKEMVRARAPSLAWLLPVSTTSGHKSAAAAVIPSELVHHLEPMARNIAVLLAHLEQVAAKQEQLAKSIVALQEAERDKQRLSSAAPAPASKAAQPATQSSAAQSSAVRSSSVLPTPAARAPLPLR
jgi:hypothetical protein